jgi:hypothetical protein
MLRATFETVPSDEEQGLRETIQQFSADAWHGNCHRTSQIDGLDVNTRARSSCFEKRGLDRWAEEEDPRSSQKLTGRSAVATTNPKNQPGEHPSTEAFTYWENQRWETNRDVDGQGTWCCRPGQEHKHHVIVRKLGPRRTLSETMGQIRFIEGKLSDPEIDLINT